MRMPGEDEVSLSFRPACLLVCLAGVGSVAFPSLRPGLLLPLASLLACLLCGAGRLLDRHR